ncbi:MAG: hypothetical protein LAP61_27615 [Acidobacteriia bacterium]|nr:hypothetical protein [Terriglobia bacterium]
MENRKINSDPQNRPVSLHPIPYREALRDLLQVKPEPKPAKAPSKAKRKLSVLAKDKK